MKKVFKILVLIIVIYSVTSLLYIGYLKYLIRKEKNRIASEKSYGFIIDNESKFNIFYRPNIMDYCFSCNYNIDLDKGIVEIYSESWNPMPLKHNKFHIWWKMEEELEQLRTENYDIERIILNENEKQELEKLIKDVLNKNKTINEYYEEHKITTHSYALEDPSTYLISSINKSKVVMDNVEQIELFFKIIGKEYFGILGDLHGY